MKIILTKKKKIKTNKVKLNVIDLIEMEAISIYLEKPVLCKQEEFDYKLSLFS